MSRSTLPAIILTVLCFAAALLGLSYACVFAEVDGLSVISHGIHILPENEAALIEKLEQIAEENYHYWMGTDQMGVIENKISGTVITMTYRQPINLTWTDNPGREGIPPRSIHAVVDTIIAVIPDDPKRDFRLIVHRPSPEPGQHNPDRYIFVMPHEMADELRELIGQTPARITPA